MVRRSKTAIRWFVGPGPVALAEYEWSSSKEGDSGTHSDDFTVDLIGVKLPSSGMDTIYFRWADNDNTLALHIYASGAGEFNNRDGGVENPLLNWSAGELLNGQTLRIRCLAAEAWVWIQGVLEDYSDQATILDGTTYVLQDLDDGLRVNKVVFDVAS